MVEAKVIFTKNGAKVFHKGKLIMEAEIDASNLYNVKKVDQQEKRQEPCQKQYKHGK